jgi:hypothetical protein
MNDAKRVHVELELERDTETIGGELSVERAAASGFYGWLELIDQLERARRGAVARDARTPQEHPQEVP